MKNEGFVIFIYSNRKLLVIFLSFCDRQIRCVFQNELLDMPNKHSFQNKKKTRNSVLMRIRNMPSEYVETCDSQNSSKKVKKTCPSRRNPKKTRAKTCPTDVTVAQYFDACL